MTALSVALSEELQLLRHLCGSPQDVDHVEHDLAPAACPSFAVPGTTRDIRVKVASDRYEWEEAFRLVTENYRERGYEVAAAEQLRFTPYHALPDTVVFVAIDEGRVIATLSLVPDNSLLGLPMEALYRDEIAQLRATGRHLLEVSSLADRDLSLREFTPVFTALMRLTAQYTVWHGADTWVIAINPRHRRFYSKIMGFVPFGPLRNYASVQNHPAEAYMLDPYLLKTNAPEMFEQLFGEWLPPAVLGHREMPLELVRYFSQRSCRLTGDESRRILDWVELFGSPRLW